ncbi:MAG TPA: hypothetical protein VHT21_24735 [Stellaceae bacterium]|nr:hypothetical protein [Stellaceae bacterium]
MEKMRAHLDTLKRLTETEGRDFSALTSITRGSACHLWFARRSDRFSALR